MPAKTAAPAQSKVSAQAYSNSWLFSSCEGERAPLPITRRKTGDIGTFSSPQKVAIKMQQRVHQAFFLDIGDIRDQMVRVKVPDMNLTFVKARKVLLIYS